MTLDVVVGALGEAATPLPMALDVVVGLVAFCVGTAGDASVALDVVVGLVAFCVGTAGDASVAFDVVGLVTLGVGPEEAAAVAFAVVDGVVPLVVVHGILPAGCLA